MELLPQWPAPAAAATGDEATETAPAALATGVPAPTLGGLPAAMVNPAGLTAEPAAPAVGVEMVDVVPPPAPGATTNKGFFASAPILLDAPELATAMATAVVVGGFATAKTDFAGVPVGGGLAITNADAMSCEPCWRLARYIIGTNTSSQRRKT